MNVNARKARLSEFFRKEYGKLVAYTRRLIDDTADRDAEDIVQDVFIGFFDKADITVPINHLSAYIYRSLKNKVIDLFRKKELPLQTRDWEEHIDDLSLSRWAQGKEGEPLTLLEERENYHRLFTAIQALDEAEKAVLIATEFEGRTYRSLAEEWTLPLGTHLARKHRAIKKIKEMIR